MLSLLDSPLPQQFAGGELAIKQRMLQGGAYAQLRRLQDAEPQSEGRRRNFPKIEFSAPGEVARARGVLACRQNDQEVADTFFARACNSPHSKETVILQTTDLTNLGHVALARNTTTKPSIGRMLRYRRPTGGLHDRHPQKLHRAT